MKNCDQKLVNTLARINAKMDGEAAKAAPKIQAYLALNQEFHFELYRRCENEDLMNLIELLWMRYGPMLNLIRGGPKLGTGHATHEDMIEAFRRTDAEAAQNDLREDLRSAAQAIEAAIEAGDKA